MRGGKGRKNAPRVRGGRVFKRDPLAFRDPLASTPKIAPKKPPRVVSVKKPVILPKPPLVIPLSPPCGGDDDDDDGSCTPGSKARTGASKPANKIVKNADKVPPPPHPPPQPPPHFSNLPPYPPPLSPGGLPLPGKKVGGFSGIYHT